jgi:hypothetical protein
MGQFTVYKSTDSGATALTGQTGVLVSVLDACLVNGYTASVTSITRSGTTATVTTATAHGLSTGNSTTIAGASQTDYNITAVVTVTSTTTFTYTVANSPVTPATGTITWKKLGAGWTKSFSGTSKAAYRQGGGNQFYLRVQDDGPGAGTFKEARVVGYEAMTAVDTGTNAFPTAAQKANGLFVRKSTTADGTSRAYVIVADDRTVYVFVSTGDTAGTYNGWMFGDFYSYVNSDGFRTMLIANDTENSANTSNLTGLSATTTAVQITGHYFARGHVGTGGSVNFGKHGDVVKGSGLGRMIFGLPYPNPADGGFYLSPIWIHDPVTTPVNGIRGTMRGFWQALVTTTTLNDLDTFSGTGALAGKTFLLLKQQYNQGSSDGQVVMEISNTVDTN